MTMTAPRSLGELEARLAQDMGWLNLPVKPWVPARIADGRPVLDVAVVGAGLCGLVTLAALNMVGIYAVRAFDGAAEAREGPWVTYARMRTLRTRKEAAGPALGLPALTFRAWFEAQHGAAAFEQMQLIPREIWMDYLVWYRRVLDLPVDNRSRIANLQPRADGLIALAIEHGSRIREVLARRVVLATGLDGLGAPVLPDIARRVSPRLLAHGADLIDMAGLKDQRVAVVGAGASAMDNAAAALEAGAARVDIFVRRQDIPRVDKFTGVGSKGMTHGYYGLPDADRWTLMLEGERAQIPPPRHSVQRVSRFSNADFHLGSPIQDMLETDSGVELVTPKGRYQADFVIFATGFGIDFAARPEFSVLADRIQTWGERYRPAPADAHAGLAASPYLGPHFEFLPRPGLPESEAQAVGHIHCFAYPAVMSHGKITSGIPSISDGAQRLARGIARSLFVEDRAKHISRFRQFDTPELLGDEWRDADQIMEPLDD